MTRTRLLRGSSGRRRQVSTTVTHHLYLYAHTIANDIFFMPYLDGMFDITNRIAEEGKMAGALAGEKNFQLVKVLYGSTDENISSLLQRSAQAFLQT